MGVIYGLPIHIAGEARKLKDYNGESNNTYIYIYTRSVVKGCIHTNVIITYPRNRAHYKYPGEYFHILSMNTPH